MCAASRSDRSEKALVSIACASPISTIVQGDQSAERRGTEDDAGSGGNALGHFRFEILLYGEDRWASNQMLFTDEVGALNHAWGMFSRWIIIEKIRTRYQDAPKGERYLSGSEHPEWAGSRVEIIASIRGPGGGDQRVDSESAF